jgi:hypothetical protein
MVASLALFAMLQAVPAIPSPNTLALPNDVYYRWPDAVPHDYRWTLRAPPDFKPFVVVTKHGGQIAVRWDYSPRGHYVAMRQTDERLEQADSRECDFSGVMQELRDLPPAELVIPGSLPIQQLAGPPQFHAWEARVTVLDSKQNGAEPVTVTMSAQYGPLRDWVDRLFTATEPCWQPLQAPTSAP